MIPLLDLKAQYRSIGEEIRRAIEGVLESGRFVLGTEVEAFESELASYCGARYAVALNSGTSALHLALLAAGVGVGDEVVTVPYTFVASVAAVTYTGARPVFVDIEARSATMAVPQIEAAITSRTKAILPVHLFGQPADLDPILEIAERYGLVVIEDAAQAHGARYKDHPVGSIGHLGCFSFYPTKNLGAYGEGGAVVTNNLAYASKIKLLRSWGEEKRYLHVLRGFNYRMEALQGAILRVKLRHLEDWNAARRARAARYTDLLRGAGVQTPEEMPYARHVYSVYGIRAPERDRLQESLSAAGVQTVIHYPVPVHLLEPYQQLGYRAGQFPVAEQLAREQLSLPIYPELHDQELEHIAQVIRARQQPSDLEAIETKYRPASAAAIEVPWKNREGETFLDLRQDASLIAQVRSARQYPPLAGLLTAVNSDSSIFASVRANAWAREQDGNRQAFAARLDLVFQDEPVRFARERHQQILDRLVELWQADVTGDSASVRIELLPCRFISSGREGSAFRIEIEGRGENQEIARLRWGLCVARVQQALLFVSRSERQKAGTH